MMIWYDRHICRRCPACCVASAVVCLVPVADILPGYFVHVRICEENEHRYLHLRVACMLLNAGMSGCWSFHRCLPVVDLNFERGALHIITHRVTYLPIEPDSHNK